MRARFFFSLFLLLFAGIASAAMAQNLSCGDNVAVVPLQVQDKPYADRLITATRRAALHTYALACDPFLTLAENNKAFSTIGLNSYQSVLAEQLSAAQLRYLIDKVGLTHIIFLSQKSDGLAVGADLYRIEGSSGQLLRLDTFSLAQQPRSESWIEAHIWRLRPNAFTSTVPSRSLVFRAKDTGRTEILGLGPSPTLFGGAGISNVEHPARFDSYAWSFGLSPMATGYYFNQNFYRNFESEFREKAGRLRLLLGCVGASLDATVHTPLGASYLSYSIAPCLMQRDFSAGIKGIELTAWDRMTIGQRAFYYKNDFLFFEWSQVTVLSPIYEEANGTIHMFNELSLGIGVFVP